MPFNWKEYFRLAEFLAEFPLGDLAQEALWRTSVSRAYYAAFCYARNHARDSLGFQPKKSAQDHSQLRAHLRKNQDYVQVADLLNKLRAWRNSCDYEDTLDGLQLIVKGAIQAAREVIVQLDQRNSH
jgi:uncharacterized protein (UPF0332 family)